MTLRDDDIKYLVTNLFNKQSERDKQTKIGASEIGNPCNYCLATRLTGRKQKPSVWWMGARIGTAIHNALEREVEVTEPVGKFAALKGAVVEQKIVIGELPGYGVIKSTPDLVLPEHNHLIDYKTSTRKKVQQYKLDGLPPQYVVQQNLYAWGINKLGVPIDTCSLIFINREGSTDDDIWVTSFDYDEQVALDAWARLDKAWQYVDNGGDVENIASHEDCFYCMNILGRW